MFPPEGNFDIDAGDGGGGGDHLGPQKSKKSQKQNRTKTVHFCRIFQKYLQNIFIYRKRHPIRYALKITIYNTKHTKNTRIHFENPNCSKGSMKNQTFI